MLYEVPVRKFYYYFRRYYLRLFYFSFFSFFFLFPEISDQMVNPPLIIYFFLSFSIIINPFPCTLILFLPY